MVSKEFIERVESYAKTLVDALFDMKPLEMFFKDLNTLMRVIVVDNNETIMAQDGNIIIRIIRNNERMLIVIEHDEISNFVLYKKIRLCKAILNEMFRRLGIEIKAILYKGGFKKGMWGNFAYDIFLKKGKTSTYYVPTKEGYTKIYENEKVTIISTSAETRPFSEEIRSLVSHVYELRGELYELRGKLNILYHDPLRVKDAEKIKGLMDKINFLFKILIAPRDFNLPPIDDEIIIKELEKTVEETSKALEEIRKEYIKIKSKAKRKRE
jgi:hypothetical protein